MFSQHRHEAFLTVAKFDRKYLRYLLDNWYTTFPEFGAGRGYSDLVTQHTVIGPPRTILLSGDDPYSHCLNEYGPFFSCVVDDSANGIAINIAGTCVDYL